MLPTNRRFKIALDLDGVLAEAITVWLDIYNRNYGAKLVKRDVDRWDFWKGLNISRRTFESIFNQAWKRWKEIPSTEDNITRKVEALQRHGQVDILSSIHPRNKRYAQAWLDHQDILVNRIRLCPAHLSKARYPYRVFIDDSPHVIQDAAKNRRVAILYDQPWNRSLQTHTSIRRIHSLREAVSIVRNEASPKTRRD